MRGLFALFALVLVLLGAPASASTFRGAGSQGFLATCSGTFNYSNDLLNTDAFGAGFATAGVGAAAPTLVASNATGPDGSANSASTLTIPAVPAGSSNFSQLYQQITRTYILPTSASVWAKVASGAGNGTVVLEVTDGTNWNTAKIPSDGAWHQVSFFAPASTYVAKTIYYAVGVDLRDARQSASTGTIVLNLYHPQLVNRRGPSGGPWPYVASAGTAASTTVTLPCPRNIAFRDFRPLKPYAGNPVTSPNASNAYEAGGVAHFMTSQLKVGGKYYAWGFSTNTADHNQWPVFNLYSGPSPFKMTEEAGNPILRIPGSNDTGTRGTVTGLSYYMLHPWQSPVGCTISGTKHPYCYYFSAMDAGNNSSIFMAFGDSITGPFTFYPNNTSPTPLLTGIFTSIPLNYPSLPSVIQRGNKLYMYVSHNNNIGTFTDVFSSPITDGLTWTFESVGLQPPISGVDYDASVIAGVIDSAVHKNKCGFYEYYVTHEASSPNRQQIAYAVSDDPLGPWYKYYGIVIPLTSSLYGGTPYYGDVTITEHQGQYVLTGNYDDGIGTDPTYRSKGVAASMRDACA